MKTFGSKKIVSALLVIVALAPFAALAQGLVPCTGVENCDFNKFIELIQKVINFLLFSIAMPLAAIVFAWAGIMMLTAGGNEQKVTEAKEIFWWVFVGFIIALAAWLIVDTITEALLKSDYSLV